MHAKLDHVGAIDNIKIRCVVLIPKNISDTIEKLTIHNLPASQTSLNLDYYDQSTIKLPDTLQKLYNELIDTPIYIVNDYSGDKCSESSILDILEKMGNERLKLSN